MPTYRKSRRQGLLRGCQSSATVVVTAAVILVKVSSVRVVCAVGPRSALPLEPSITSDSVESERNGHCSTYEDLSDEALCLWMPHKVHASDNHLCLGRNPYWGAQGTSAARLKNRKHGARATENTDPWGPNKSKSTPTLRYKSPSTPRSGQGEATTGNPRQHPPRHTPAHPHKSSCRGSYFSISKRLCDACKRGRKHALSSSSPAIGSTSSHGEANTPRAAAHAQYVAESPQRHPLTHTTKMRPALQHLRAKQLFYPPTLSRALLISGPSALLPQLLQACPRLLPR